jgi:acyl-CoA thioesterase FadM
MYFKEFEVRWSDLDGNMHLANSAYINFMSHTRMSFLLEQGISLTANKYFILKKCLEEVKYESL